MQQRVWVQITDFRNGAYPLTEYKNGMASSQNQELIKQLLAQKVSVQTHCNLYYKTTVKLSDYTEKIILICKKDCLLLQNE